MGDNNPYPWDKTISRGDGDPFPLSGEDPFPLGLPPGEWVGGRGMYTAYQAGHFVYVYAKCWAPFGSIVELVSLVVTFPPTYGLSVYQTPSPLPAIELFKATATFYSKEKVESVPIWDLDGKHEVKVKRDKA